MLAIILFTIIFFKFCLIFFFVIQPYLYPAATHPTFGVSISCMITIFDVPASLSNHAAFSNNKNNFFSQIATNCKIYQDLCQQTMPEDIIGVTDPITLLTKTQ